MVYGWRRQRAGGQHRSQQWLCHPACCPHGSLVSLVAQQQHGSWPQSTELLARRALGLLKSWGGGGSRRAEQRELILSLFIVICRGPQLGLGAGHMGAASSHPVRDHKKQGWGGGRETVLCQESQKCKAGRGEEAGACSRLFSSPPLQSNYSQQTPYTLIKMTATQEQVTYNCTYREL